jgi:maltooligosyltrehalose trehalohydrolase
MQAGAFCLGGNRCRFVVWAPEKEKVTLHIAKPREQKIPMQRAEEGYFQLEADHIAPGTRYFYQLDADRKDLPDPASHYQPDGVHGPSQVVDHSAYSWNDLAWRGIPFKDLILYELHVGTFTPEGTFAAIIPRLDELSETGINAIELMPVSQVSGNRNWGYDGVYPYSVHNSYGSPDDLKRLIDECHQRGIAVFLDLVYNHMGPEGNYIGQFGPYFTSQYCTPWGDAINFDGAWSDGVRDFFSDNAVFWATQYHFDGLRLDAIHTVYDTGAVNFWEYTQEKLKHIREQTGRSFYLIAESDLNSPRVIQSPEIGGFGFEAQWLDDFHHALYVLLNERARNRYEDFGEIEQLAKALKEGFVHSGDYVGFRKKKFGRSSAGVAGNHFVAFTHNHDQVGNHPRGQRWAGIMDFERLKLGAAMMMLSPYVPMLFMGEEYGEDNPFYYFVSHLDPELVEAVRKGRKEEFSGFNWDVEPPDPQSEQTFNQSKLSWEKRKTGKHAVLLNWYKELIRLRREEKPLQSFDKNAVDVSIEQEKVLIMRRRAGTGALYCFFNFAEHEITLSNPVKNGGANKLLDSTEKQWQESGRSNKGQSKLPPLATSQPLNLPPLSVVLYKQP